VATTVIEDEVFRFQTYAQCSILSGYVGASLAEIAEI